MLRREIIGFRLALQPEFFDLLVFLVHVVGNRAHVVEELAVNRPTVVFAPDVVADESCPQLAHRVF